MIQKAQVSLAPVRTFRECVSEVGEYSDKLERGGSCLTELLQSIIEAEAEIKENLTSLEVAEETLLVKIRNIEEILAKLEAQMEELQEELSDLEDSLSALDETIAITDDSGNVSEVPNPAYLSVSAKIAAVEGEIATLNAEMFPHKQRLERANNMRAKTDAHIDKENAALYSLNEKKSVCKQLIEELQNIRDCSKQKSSAAETGLKKIEGLINKYLGIKMAYGMVDAVAASSTRSGGGFTINVNINMPGAGNAAEAVPNQVRTYTPQEIENHQIRFDAENRISSYDGKSFGGQYNSYEERLKWTRIDDDPVMGRYEGVRGESKYIPTTRTVEGIRVKEILDAIGIDGIEYRNAEPDFAPCAKATVLIDFMTENRENYQDSDGNTLLGNFAQADEACAKLWNFDEKDGRTDWKATDVRDYRKAHVYTWHEKCDTKTMQMVPTEINGYFRHSGGCSECRVRDQQNTAGGEFDE